MGHVGLLARYWYLAAVYSSYTCFHVFIWCFAFGFCAVVYPWAVRWLYAVVW